MYFCKICFAIIFSNFLIEKFSSHSTINSFPKIGNLAVLFKTKIEKYTFINSSADVLKLDGVYLETHEIDK